MALSHDDKTEILARMETLSEDLRKLSGDFCEYKNEMRPLAEFLRTAQIGRKFLIWISSVLAAVGAIVAFVKLIMK